MRRLFGSVRARAALGATLVVAVALLAAGAAVLLSLRSNLVEQAGTEVRFIGEEHSPDEPHVFSSFYQLDSEDEVRSTLERMMTLLVPALTIGLGVVIASIIGAVLAAILSAYQLPL